MGPELQSEPEPPAGSSSLDADVNGSGAADGGMDDGEQSRIQAAIDAATDGATIVLGPEPLTANLKVSGKRLTLRCDATGSLTEWTCNDKSLRALVVAEGARVTVTGCVFKGCDGGTLEAHDSGALRLLGSGDLEVRGCIFRNNAAYRGPVVRAEITPGENANLVLVNNVMHANLAYAAGAVYAEGALRVSLRNNLIHSNTAFDFSGAVWLRGVPSEQLVFEKNVLFGNRANRGAALESYGGESGVINSSILLGNLPRQIASSWQAVYSTTSGEHPFVAPTKEDFSLRSGSHAIDSGDPALETDPDGTRTDQGVAVHALPRE